MWVSDNPTQLINLTRAGSVYKIEQTVKIPFTLSLGLSALRNHEEVAIEHLNGFLEQMLVLKRLSLPC